MTTPDRGLFDVVAKLNVTLGDVATALVENRKTTERLSQVITYQQPTPLPIVRGVTLSGTGFAMVDMGGPNVGYRWNVKRLGVVGSPDATATVTGRADWYAGNTIPASALPFPAEGHRWMMTTLPNDTAFSNNVITIVPQNRLIVVVSGGTAGQQLSINAEVEDIPDSGRGRSPVSTL